ncbi:hypothetical protein HDU85_007681 [Gaertneriomyces sp. JEL0708]|nr:hypothetical protein HDU85_007681 [Gaertneriomyces sp. JEL0708]
MSKHRRGALSILPLCLLAIAGAAAAALAHNSQTLLAPPAITIAVIGAGAAGSSFAYHLSQSDVNQAVDMVMYEATDHVGGRALSITLDGVKVELGASIFLTENKLLYDAAKNFNLSIAQLTDRAGNNNPPWGLWNGHDFVFKASKSSSKTAVDMLWRYGLSPLTTNRLAEGLAKQFAEVAYDDASGRKAATIDDLIDAWKFRDHVTQDTQSWFKASNVGDKYIEEIIQAATRVNYAQNIDINAISALVCMEAGNGLAVSVAEGNEKIFQGFVSRSGAKLKLEHRVRSVRKQHNGFLVETEKGNARFDAVVLAVPRVAGGYNIRLENLAHPDPPPFPYIHLHVTIVSGTLRASHFAGHTPDNIPGSIFTTPSVSQFLSLSQLSDSTSPPIYKIFSHATVSNADLSALFESTREVVRKEWDSYPVLSPGFNYSSLPVVLDEAGVWWTNGFERVFSTMESETVIGKKVAGMVADWVKQRTVM